MKTEYLRRSPGNRSLILIVAGWSTDYRLFEGISFEGWDIAVAYDFSSLDFDGTLLSGYSTVYLYAWSLGVFAAAHSIPSQYVTAAFAINGTCSPVSDTHGIPSGVYEMTCRTLSASTLEKFRRRIFGGTSAYNEKSALVSHIADIENLKFQLDVIRNAQNDGTQQSFMWNRAYISERDMIFPQSQQYAYWETGLSSQNIITLSSPHYVDFATIIKQTLPDIKSIERNFSSAMVSYNDNATAQRVMAEKMMEILRNCHDIPQGPRVLEIGPGSGLFTRMYADIINPVSIDFVDLTETPRFGIAAEEYYHRCDAESFMDSTNKSWDIILTSATMQWFANPHLFLSRVSSSLNRGGFFLASSFTEGTLAELDSARPTPLLYRTEKQLAQWMDRLFRQSEVMTETISLNFENFRDLVLHLRQTGVCGQGQIAAADNRDMNAIFKLKDTRTLTYRPIYLFGRI